MLVRALPVAVLAALKVSVVALVLGAEAATAAVLAAGLACVVVALGARAGR